MLPTRHRHKREKKYTFSRPSTLFFHPTITGVTKLSCTKDTALDQSGHTIGILGILLLYVDSRFITGFSGIATGGKGLKLVGTVLVILTR